MSAPRLEGKGLREPAAWEYVLRFAFGGFVCAMTGVLGKAYGPVVGGFCLAFPSILPASLTLLQRHDGRGAALDDARGGRLGSIGLAAFALAVVCLGGTCSPAIVLSLAAVAWFIVSTTLWWLEFGR